MAYPNQQQGQQQGQQAPDNRNPNRLHLNFGFNNSPSAFGAEAGRAFPTTPSTFPQPFPNSNGQQEVWGTQQTTSGITNQGYFYNNPNPYQQQQQQGYASHGLPSPQPGATSFRTSPGGFSDATNGLAHQFQHQNLGGNSPRSASPYGRQPSPGTASRARTAGQAQYGSYLNTTSNTPPHPQGPSIYDDEPPVKNPEKYSTAITERVKLQKMLTQEFFKENVERARARNERWVEDILDSPHVFHKADFPSRAKDLESTLLSKEISDSRKESRKNNMRKSEANFLRFLRTSERPQNYNTLKIIGKGAFGEVRLVQRRHDGRIYALKSLIKAEMVSLGYTTPLQPLLLTSFPSLQHKKDQLAHVRAERDILANADSPWLVKLHTSFQDSTFLYMLMEFLPGGDLMTMLIKYEIFSEDITRFYMAEITLAIEAVHKLGFIHRWVKTILRCN